MDERIPYARHQVPPPVIWRAIRLYLRPALSCRDVEERLAERGLDVSDKIVGRWVLMFCPAIARRLRRQQPRYRLCWHLDQMVVGIGGERHDPWRTVDDEGRPSMSWSRLDETGPRR